MTEVSELMDDLCRLPAWYDQVLTFTQVFKDVDGESGSKRDTNFCFVQYFMVCSGNLLRADKNDKVLNCLRLPWP